MRRLVAISNRTTKLAMALAAIPIALTSLHLAASARIASLRRQQEAVDNQLSAISNRAPADLRTPGTVSAAEPAAIAGASLSAGSKPADPAAAAHKRQIVISIADRRLALLEDGQLIKTYPIAVGTSDTPSPDGDFVIVNHAKDPVYRHGDKEIAPGKDNPLGSRWMGLSLKGYGIHGTNVQSSVGKAASHGCFRMRRKDVEELYALVQVGDTVTIRRERDAMIAQVFAAPAAPAATVAAQTANAGETQVAAATVTTVETIEQ
ncbi:MAG TPA: L,D-transpeptidase family protein [Candidatus Angelobacter sp.]|jgi:lipoprotein-anchoring transpeptidase ErfK/SrfK